MGGSTKVCRIDLYSHNVTFTKMTPDVRAALMKFCQRLMTFKTVYKPGRGHHDIPDRVYAASNRKRSILRFHIHQYEELLKFLKYHGWEKDSFKIHSHVPVDGDCVDFDFTPDKKPFEYQEGIIEHFVTPGHTKVSNLQTGLGKAASLDSKIKVPNGWLRMGQMEIGQEVITQDGSTCNVIGVYPQGELDLYWVTFADGRRTECCLEHLWSVYSSDNKLALTEVSTVVDTAYIRNVLERGESRVYIDLIDSEQNADHVYSQDSYAVGFNVTNAQIPNEYLNGSTAQRMALLNGIFDTPGFSTAGQAMLYKTLDLKVATDLVYLVRSLGGMASFTQYNPDSGKYGVVMRVPWLVSPSEGKRRLQLVSIEYSRKAEAQCIAVDHPSKLYVTDDFIVTHNTLCGAKAIQEIGKRAVISVPGKYVYKWVGDVKELLCLEKSDIMVIRGSKALQAAIVRGLAGELDVKVIVITSTTLYNYFKAFEQDDFEGYECEPNDLYEALGAGVRLIDEAHENLYLNFKQDLYGHVAKAIYLSATLESDKPFVEKILRLAYPKSLRYNNIPYNRYIDALCIEYYVDNVEKLRFTNPRKQYSHAMFEACIMEVPARQDAFCTMVYNIISVEYLKDRQPGQKLLIFAYTTKLCTILAEYLERAINDPTIIVNRYIAQDDDEQLYNADIVISTLKSAGTAIDIPGLRVCLMTVALKSSQQNTQALGRLRELRAWPEITPKFLYIAATNIPKHQEYHHHKLTTFKGKVKNHNTISSYYHI